MKLRSLALALSLSLAATGVAAPVVQAQETRTMADKYDLKFGPIPKPFTGDNGDGRSMRIPYPELPDGTELTILNPNFMSGDSENGLFVNVLVHTIGIQVFPDRIQGTPISNTVDFFVAYPDGSTEVVEHTFTVYPLQKFLYSPRIDNNVVEEGIESTLTIEDLPKGAQIQLSDVPAGWEVDVEGNALKVNASEVGHEDVVAYVTFADGSSLPVTFQITVEPKPTTEPKPTDNSGSSSSTTIIALILGLLGLGGAAAFFFNYMAR